MDALPVYFSSDQGKGNHGACPHNAQCFKLLSVSARASLLPTWMLSAACAVDRCWPELLAASAAACAACQYVQCAVVAPRGKVMQPSALCSRLACLKTNLRDDAAQNTVACSASHVHEMRAWAAARKPAIVSCRRMFSALSSAMLPSRSSFTTA